MAEKKTDFKKAFGKFFYYIGKYKAALIASVLLSVVGAVLTLIGPNKLGEATDLIEDQPTASAVL